MICHAENGIHDEMIHADKRSPPLFGDVLSLPWRWSTARCVKDYCQEEIEEICLGTVEDRKASSAGRKRRRGLQKIGGQNEKEVCENEKEASS